MLTPILSCMRRHPQKLRWRLVQIDTLVDTQPTTVDRRTILTKPPLPPCNRYRQPSLCFLTPSLSSLSLQRHVQVVAEVADPSLTTVLSRTPLQEPPPEEVDDVSFSTSRHHKDRRSEIEPTLLRLIKKQPSKKRRQSKLSEQSQRVKQWQRDQHWRFDVDLVITSTLKCEVDPNLQAVNIWTTIDSRIDLDHWIRIRSNIHLDISRSTLTYWLQELTSPLGLALIPFPNGLVSTRAILSLYIS